MTQRLNAHPLAMWAALAAVAAGLGVSADLSTESPSSIPPTTTLDAEVVDAVVLEVEQRTIPLHIPAESPIWEGATTLCGAAAGVMSILGYGVPNCDIGYQRPPIETTRATLYVTDVQVRMDFSGQTLIGDVAADGSFGSWSVLDPATGQTLPWGATGNGGAGLAAMASSIELSNLIGPMGGIRTASTAPELRVTGESRAGHAVNGYGYAYSVSGGVTLPDGTESGVAISVEGMARYADQGPFFNDGRIIGVIDGLAGNMLFQLLEPPADLLGLRDVGGLLSVDEIVRIAAYRAVVAPGDVGGATMELLQGQAHTTILDARREQVPASMFGTAGQSAPCDCSCAAYDRFMEFVELPPAQRDQDPRALPLLACGRQCVGQWSLRCHR